MLTIKCIECKNEFKVSGTDLEERHRDNIHDLCPACEEEKKNTPLKKSKVVPRSIKSKDK